MEPAQLISEEYLDRTGLQLSPRYIRVEFHFAFLIIRNLSICSAPGRKEGRKEGGKEREERKMSKLTESKKTTLTPDCISNIVPVKPRPPLPVIQLSAAVEMVI